MAIYKNRQKFTGDPCVGANIRVKYGEDVMDETILDEALADLQKGLKNTITYVEELPEEIDNSIYGIEHNIEVTKDYNTYADDIISTYCHLDSNRYVPNEGVTLKSEGVAIAYFSIGSSDYTDDSGRKYDFLKKYNFSAHYEETHTDYYAGDKERGIYTQLADMKEARLEFVSKSELGEPNGVATLDNNGVLHLSQMPTSAWIYLGQWDASTGVAPETPARNGCYYEISVEGTIDGVHYQVKDWIVWNGTEWEKSANTADVQSVNGQTGVVVLEKLTKGNASIGVDESKPVLKYNSTSLNVSDGLVEAVAPRMTVNGFSVVTKINGLGANNVGELNFSEMPLRDPYGDIVGYIGYGQPHNPGTGWFAEDGIYIQNKGEEDSGLHIDGQKITFWTPNDEDNVLEIWDRDDDSVLFAVDSSGYADKSRRTQLLENKGASVTTDGSVWNAGLGGKVVWGQKWVDNSATTRDSGDISIFLKDEGSAETANLCIDGDVYARGAKCLTDVPSGNVTATYDGSTLHLYIKG